MTNEEPAAERREIRIGAALAAAFACVFAGFSRFARAALLPFAASVVLAVVSVPAILTVPLLDLAFTVVELLPYAVLGVALNRALLLHEEPRLLPRPLLDGRGWRYFGYSILMIILVSLLAAIIAAVVVGLVYVGNPRSFAGGTLQAGNWIFAVALLAGLLLLYVAARLSLIFPAIAVGHHWGLGNAWRAARGGQALKLFAIFGVLCILLAVIGGVASAITGQQIHIGTGVSEAVLIEQATAAGLGDIVLAALPGVLVSTVLAYLGFGLLTGAYAYAFSRLSGWGAAREDILERFE
ncbi:hypothetical protein [Pelagibius sp.]|uniref:hypothetical protein n=1 Tax=Pelagibius sp. TaxID=1931238 RepID=UPI0026279A97|nr:hypothetical protein [Pelagibius sp.]